MSCWKPTHTRRSKVDVVFNDEDTEMKKPFCVPPSLPLVWSEVRVQSKRTVRYVWHEKTMSFRQADVVMNTRYAVTKEIVGNVETNRGRVRILRETMHLVAFK